MNRNKHTLRPAGEKIFNKPLVQAIATKFEFPVIRDGFPSIYCCHSTTPPLAHSTIAAVYNLSMVTLFRYYYYYYFIMVMK